MTNTSPSDLSSSEFRRHRRRPKLACPTRRELTEFSLSFAICSYLIIEEPAGATIDDLVELRLGGTTRVTERRHLSRVLLQLLSEGWLVRDGDRYLPSCESVTDVMKHLRT
jgi:hypothetical protein